MNILISIGLILGTIVIISLLGSVAFILGMIKDRDDIFKL